MMICKYSGEEFTPTRSDQKFKDAKARISWHNERQKEIRKSKSRFDKKLHKNYCILNSVMEGISYKTFHKEFLQGKGYSFDVMTHYEFYEEENRHAIYDYILLIEKQMVTVIRYSNG